jgi:hypothetical protein
MHNHQGGEFMQWFAFLWFQLQMTKHYLDEKTFGSAQSPSNPAKLRTPIGADTLPRTSVKQVPPVAPAMKRSVSGYPSQNSFRLIGSPFGKFANNEGKNAEKLSGALDKLI